MALLDTHAAIKLLTSKGFSEDQAEAIVLIEAEAITKAISQGKDNLVTKTDLELALSDIRSDLKWLKALMFLILGLIVGLWFK